MRRGWRVATLDETLRHGREWCLAHKLYPSMAGGGYTPGASETAGYSLVGSFSNSTSGTSGSALTPAWGTGQNRTAGNLLVCLLTGTGSGTPASAPATPTGWTSSPAFSTWTQLSCGVTVYHKFAAGADAAPTFAGVTNTTWRGVCNEFTGNAPSGVSDAVGGAAPVSSPWTVATAGADVLPGELVVYAVALQLPAAGALTTETITMNNGVAPVQASNMASAVDGHVNYGYGLTTRNTDGADSVQYQQTGGSIQFLCIGIKSFQRNQISTPAMIRQSLDAAIR